MHVLGFILSLLLDVRAHIPNQPSFRSRLTHTSYSRPTVRAVAAFLIIVAFLATLVGLAARLVIVFS
jgi:hypothetical protein